MISCLTNDQILEHAHNYVYSHVKYKCNSFTEASMEGGANLYILLYNLLYMLSKVKPEASNTSKFKVNFV